MINCKGLRIKFEKIKSLKNELDLEFERIKADEKNSKENKEALERAMNIKKYLEKRVKFIKVKLVPKEFREFIGFETKKLSAFFGKTIEVPPLPKEITIEKIEQWEKQGFELHYLPEEDMTEEKDFPGWKKKPDNLFSFIKDGKVKPEVTKLEAGWVLIDGRAKPKYEYGEQMYENDILKEVIARLREEGIIAKWNRKDQGSRFNISNDELRKDEVKKAIAEVLGVGPENIRLPKTIEWNVFGNMHHKEWGETDTSEWFDEEYSGGLSDLGGLSHADNLSSGSRVAYLGFRPLCRFDNK